MKALEFIYQDTEIAFLLGNDKDVMVNATEMAKAFGKRVDDYTRLDSTQKLIQALKIKLENEYLSDKNLEENYLDNHADVRDYISNNIINSNKKRGTYMHRIIALDFASWLDVDFKIWVYSTIEDILFGNYKRHWDAHIKQEQTKEEMESIKLRLITNPTTEDVVRYFQLEQVYKNCSAEKAKAIKSQYKLDLK